MNKCTGFGRDNREQNSRKREEELSEENTPLWFWNQVFWLQFLALCLFSYSVHPNPPAPQPPPTPALNLSEVLITDEWWCATGSSHAVQLPVCACVWPRSCSDWEQWRERWEVRENEKQKKRAEGRSWLWLVLGIIHQWEHMQISSHAA